jgi:hypothetical protein
MQRTSARKQNTIALERTKENKQPRGSLRPPLRPAMLSEHGVWPYQHELLSAHRSMVCGRTNMSF